MKTTLIVAVLYSSIAIGEQTAPASAPMPYETYCAKSQSEKNQIFKASSPEQKVSLWRTQVERWRDANNARLSADQRTLVQDLLAILGPATFTPAGNTPEMKAKQQSVDARSKALFSSEDQRALDEDGPCIPKTVK